MHSCIPMAMMSYCLDLFDSMFGSITPPGGSHVPIVACYGNGSRSTTSQRPSIRFRLLIMGRSERGGEASEIRGITQTLFLFYCALCI